MHMKLCNDIKINDKNPRETSGDLLLDIQEKNKEPRHGDNYFDMLIID